jgi:hypothetical protein
VHGQHRLVHVGHPFPNAPDELAELRGDGVAHRVGDVDRGGPGPDDLLDQAAEEGQLAAAGVLGGELHLVGPLAGEAHRPHGHLHHLVGILLELVLHVDRRAGQEGVDAAPLGRLEGLGRRLQVLLHAAGQRGDGRALDLLGDQPAGLELVGGGDREAGLDDVHPQAGQLGGHLVLLLRAHRGAGGLLPVAQGGVENDDALHG